MEQIDPPHASIHGDLTDIELDGSVRNATVTVSDGDNEYKKETTRFAFSQMLKFAGLRKRDLKDEEGEVEPMADVEILDNLEEEDLVYKFNTNSGRIIGVVSSKFMSISTGEVEQIVRETISSMGISEFDINKDGGLVSHLEFDFTNEEHKVENVGDVLRGGIHVKNSQFGAAALTFSRYYVVLACENGMTIPKAERSFKQIHMGDLQEVRETIQDETRRQIENIWDDTDLIKKTASIEMSIVDQAEFLWKLAVDQKITKRSAKRMIEEIQKEDSEWNSGRENIWGLINAFTGYVEHSQKPSDSSIRKLERVYQDLIRMKEKEQVESMVDDVELDEDDKEDVQQLIKVEA